MTSPEAKATEDGVQQALDAAMATLDQISTAYASSAEQFARFDDAKGYASLAESFRVAWRALHKLNAAEILAGKEDVR